MGRSTILVVAMLASKGASGVTGAGFVILAATLSPISPSLVPGMAILLGIDKFMSECRALMNFIGNGVATIIIARSGANSTAASSPRRSMRGESRAN